MTIPPDFFKRIWDDAGARLDEQVLGGPLTGPHSYHAAPSATDALKPAASMMISKEQAMDYGLIPDTRPPVHISWRSRMSWRISDWRERVGRKVGGWIAGVDLSERDDW